MGNPFTVSLVCWHDGEPLLKSVREAVSRHEQSDAEKQMWDGQDESCRHALVLSHGGDAIGCGRLLNNGQIGCIAVMPQWREQHVGTAILESLINHAHAHNYPQVEVEAQTSALPFYHAFGFTEQGEVFMKDGQPHVRMTKLLSG
ncbi:MAG: GNAT family N-acetyltransferase [Gallionellales bacterium GWA2_60_18]|nr:MAG: GNAT family N-acetyltransferase [Gallionellales bacterium GWA2_60_18]